MFGECGLLLCNVCCMLFMICCMLLCWSLCFVLYVVHSLFDICCLCDVLWPGRCVDHWLVIVACCLLYVWLWLLLLVAVE